MCSNGARVFVHESIFDEFVEKVVAATAKLRIGDTMDGRAHIGALISKDHLNKVTGFIERAVDEVGIKSELLFYLSYHQCFFGKFSKVLLVITF